MSNEPRGWGDWVSLARAKNKNQNPQSKAAYKSTLRSTHQVADDYSPSSTDEYLNAYYMQNHLENIKMCENQ